MTFKLLPEEYLMILLIFVFGIIIGKWWENK